MSNQRNKADAALYREYGRTMRAAQTFEYTVRELVYLREPLIEEDDRSTVEIDAEIARFFKRPLAKLAKTLDVDEEFAEELQAAVSTRNSLAHEYFMTTFLEINVGIATHKELIATLVEARRRYGAVNDRLEALVAERHGRLGIDTSTVLTTPEAMRRALLPGGQALHVGAPHRGVRRARVSSGGLTSDDQPRTEGSSQRCSRG